MKSLILGLAMLGTASMAMAQEAMPPTQNPNATPDSTMQEGRSATLSPAETKARRSLTDGGYSNVTNLAPDGKGWTARAEHSGKPVKVRIAPDGTVSRDPMSR